MIARSVVQIPLQQTMSRCTSDGKEVKDVIRCVDRCHEYTPNVKQPYMPMVWVLGSKSNLESGNLCTVTVKPQQTNKQNVHVS